MSEYCKGVELLRGGYVFNTASPSSVGGTFLCVWGGNWLNFPEHITNS